MNFINLFKQSWRAVGGDWFGEAKFGENYGRKILAVVDIITMVQKLALNGNLILLSQYATGFLQ